MLKYETSRNPYYLCITFQWGPFTVSSTVCKCIKYSLKWFHSRSIYRLGLTTHVLPHLHLKVTIVAPVFSPRVLDQPIRDTILYSIANCKNSMVHILPQTQENVRKSSYIKVITNKRSSTQAGRILICFMVYIHSCYLSQHAHLAGTSN